MGIIIETNLVDLSKVRADDPSTWNEHIKYEVPRQWGVRHNKTKRKVKTLEERKQAIKEYQHNYYLKVTKIKRQGARNGK